MSDVVYREDAIGVVCSVCGNDCDESEFLYDVPQDEQIILCPEHYGLATMPSAVSPHNDDYAKFIDELLAYEERNDMFNLTTKERAEFQSYVRERMEL